jgi:hypothetical protein
MLSYTIVRSDNGGIRYDHEQIKNIEEKVNTLLKQGWYCIGGVVISFSESGHVMGMYQTMGKGQV